MTNKKYDLILWGATSFVGQLIAKYITSNYPDLSWALGGRSEQKLQNLKQELITLNNAAVNLDILIGDSSDESFLVEMVKTTKVIISTVGPYLKYGEKLIKACAENGIDYCDLTGEAPFVRKMLDCYSVKAQESGSRIIHCCGFDSIPSDLGVYFLNEQAKQTFNEPIISADCVVTKLKGGYSGGTIASMINMIEEIKIDKEIKKVLSNPYSLCKSRDHQQIKQENLINYKYNKKINKWLTTFIMSSINSKIVHASNNLSNYEYSKEFRYTEYLLVKSYWQALSTYLTMNAFMLLLSIKPIQKILEKYFLPKPGEGPSTEQQINGSFEFNVYGETKSHHTLAVKITGDQDPGYGSTAKMIVESAICLLNTPTSQVAGGFWTPSSALGDGLITRLNNNAGVKFSIIGAHDPIQTTSSRSDRK